MLVIGQNSFIGIWSWSLTFNKNGLRWNNLLVYPTAWARCNDIMQLCLTVFKSFNSSLNPLCNAKILHVIAICALDNTLLMTHVQHCLWMCLTLSAEDITKINFQNNAIVASSHTWKGHICICICLCRHACYLNFVLISLWTQCRKSWSHSGTIQMLIKSKIRITGVEYDLESIDKRMNSCYTCDSLKWNPFQVLVCIFNDFLWPFYN